MGTPRPRPRAPRQDRALCASYPLAMDSPRCQCHAVRHRMDRRSGGRDVDPEDAALPLLALDANAPVMRLGDMPHDRKPQPGAPGPELRAEGCGGPCARPIHLVEPLEDARHMAGGDPNSFIAYLEPDVSGPSLPADADRTFRMAELDGIVDQVDERLLESGRIR